MYLIEMQKPEPRFGEGFLLNLTTKQVYFILYLRLPHSFRLWLRVRC